MLHSTHPKQKREGRKKSDLKQKGRGEMVAQPWPEVPEPKSERGYSNSHQEARRR